MINLTAFSAMWIDKAKSSIPRAPRIPESLLFFMAAAFGALGVYAGMFAFRHKTRKWYFLVGIPLLIIQNSVTAYLLYLGLSKN
jgi:uncharacterized membrane protein YsdA (DUF1294 family)